MFRSEDYLNFIRNQPCWICGKLAEPHHERRRADGGMGLRPSDSYSLPTCRVCHDNSQQYKDTAPDLLDSYVEMVRLLTTYLEWKQGGEK